MDVQLTLTSKEFGLLTEALFSVADADREATLGRSLETGRNYTIPVEGEVDRYKRYGELTSLLAKVLGSVAPQEV